MPEILTDTYLLFTFVFKQALNIGLFVMPEAASAESTENSFQDFSYNVEYQQYDYDFSHIRCN